MNNIPILQRMIVQKLNYDRPFYATTESHHIVSEVDHFPYKQMFRGIYDDDRPYIFHREAGFHPRNDSCYKAHHTIRVSKPTYCWEFPCTHRKPCKLNETHCKNQQISLQP